MANTTNFNWETPDDTDLVKDGAAAIRTLGSAIDTSLVDLKGGTTGQILSKTSNTDMDFTWIANDQGDITEITASAPLTGGGSSGSITVGIQDGTTAQKGAVQLENSTSSTSTTTAAVPASVKSAYDLANGAVAKTIVDAKGDLIVATAADTVSRLAVGTNDYVLTAASGETTGLKWAPATSTNEALGYKWDMWNPTNNTGTETSAPSTGTSSGNTTNISAANSSGTLTFTLGAGTYLVSLNTNAIITSSYTYAAVLDYIGGTATSYLALKASPNNYFGQWGEADISGDFALSNSFLVSATANQTITILPKGRVSGAGATTAYQFYATATIVRM